MPKSKSTYPEIAEIREDLDSLKDNVIELTKHLKQDGMDQAEAVGTVAKKRLNGLKTQSRKELKKVEDQVKKKPAQSLAIAFASGLVASLLLRGRG
jgi:ElaB/YqjD/DUF883 family membrane-anchored ribosome-binding protein